MLPSTGVLEAHSKLLNSDELDTWHIAQAPSVREMLALSREIDLHPPLHYVAQRVALDVPAPRWLASRLPSILAGLVVCLALFRYAAARMGNLFGLVAVAIFWFGPILDSAWINRPYMLWMAWLCLLLLGRDAAVLPGRRSFAVVMVFLLTLGMVMTHLIGIACIFPFLVAEGVRVWRRRKVDWALVLALVLPGMVGLGFFYQIHHLSENVFPATQLPSMDLAAGVYGAIFGNTVVIVAGCAVGVLLLFGANAVEGEDAAQRHGLSGEDAVLMVTLLLLPLLLLAPAAVFHLQFWLRYGAAAMPGLSVLAAWGVAQRLPMGRVVAVLLVAASAGYMVERMLVDTGTQGNAGSVEGGRIPIALGSLDAGLPIVAASPMTFVEMSDRESAAIVPRVFYLTDREAAIEYSHYTLFENEGKIRQLRGLRSRTEELQRFLREQPRFYVVGDYGSKEVWLLRKLAADGMKLNYLGKFESTYESDDLYEVTK